MIVDIEVDIADVMSALRKQIKAKHPNLEIRNITVKTWNQIVFKTELDDMGDKLMEWNHRVDPSRKQL